MEAHFQLTDQQFSQQFADHTLPPQWFTHLAHLRLAYILIKGNGEAKARQLMCEQIKSFDQAFGDGRKFHRTLTEASVKVVFHFMQRSSGSSFLALMEEFPRLQHNFKELLLSHYSPAQLFAEPARSAYQQPDLLAFPD